MTQTVLTFDICALVTAGMTTSSDRIKIFQECFTLTSKKLFSSRESGTSYEWIRKLIERRASLVSREPRSHLRRNTGRGHFKSNPADRAYQPRFAIVLRHSKTS